MKVLIVARCKQGRYAPFITEQVTTLERKGVACQYFGINDKGLFGYLKHFHRFRQAIQTFRPDIIHAHYGFSGLFANMQRQIPVVTTYHGSDINDPRVFRFSKIAIKLSKLNIFVSQKNIDTAKVRKNYTLIPCGVNLEDFPEIDKSEARIIMRLLPEEKYVLFAGSFDNEVKNAPLAMKAMSYIPDAKLLELKGYTRSEVAVLMNAVDCLLMTSHSEGSPQVIKEALACGCPIVSVDVGDVSEQINGVEGCFISNKNAEEMADCIKSILSSKQRTNGRTVIIERNMTNNSIADRIIESYKSVLA